MEILSEKKWDNQNNIPKDIKEVTAVNSPTGSVVVGATITTTWSYTPQANAIPGTLRVIDNATKNTFLISSTINLTSQSFSWIAALPTGTYYLAINDGSSNKYSGTFIVYQAGGAAPTPAASSGPQAPSGATPPAQPQSSSTN
ncbi:44962_t:CDS:2 [Gigaspora margarita]|uniref:44962_t:CDS:1 n=1 Tax=Gigaspora margarita TaxID=4874 RepID=A0ABM8W229_GIGMA|nr:44962_t:CDS:2 [Gigaspora margarita]